MLNDILIGIGLMLVITGFFHSLHSAIHNKETFVGNTLFHIELFIGILLVLYYFGAYPR